METRKETDAAVLMPKKEVFRGKHVIDDINLRAGLKFYMYDRTEYPDEGGIYTYYKGMPYPQRGFPYPEAVHANDLMKRVTTTLIQTIAIKDMALPILTFALLPWKKKIKIFGAAINNYSRIADWLLRSHYLEDNRYADVCRSLKTVIEDFLLQLHLPEGDVSAFTLALITMVEYDDAYRYRVEDIMTEADRLALVKNPRKEIKRLAKIYNERELTHANIVIGKIFSMLDIILLVPKISRAFSYSMDKLIQTDDAFEKMQLDNVDRYHVSIRNDYNFTGRTFDQRLEFYKEKHRASQCCKTDVKVRDYDGKVGYQCRGCGKENIATGYIFPPQIEIAPNKNG